MESVSSKLDRIRKYLAATLVLCFELKEFEEYIAREAEIAARKSKAKRTGNVIRLTRRKKK